ncbi:MAG: RNA methyltransferase [Erysipelotrichaceae bacterium]|nr:RNA methyltransferase [Erysipelotrichaceae bacterium]
MITSLENKTVKELYKLHQKKYRTDHFLLLNEELILKALEADKLERLIYTGEKPFDFDNVLEVSQEVLDKIAKKEGLSYIGVGKRIKEKKDYGKRVILLDHLQDPLNIGRIMESCLLFGYDSLIISRGSADIYNEKCLENSKGGIYSLNISHGDLIEEIDNLKKEGFMVYATGLKDNTKELHELDKSEKMAFVLGNEGSGVSEEVMNKADYIVKIDMCNIDSLNVAMAASICMYEFSR